MARFSPRPVHLATAGSLASGVWAQAALTLSGVLVARLLGVEDRGYLALLMLFAVVLWTIGPLGLPLAATYYVAQAPARAGAVVRSLAGPMAAQAVALAGVLAAILAVVLADEPRRVWTAGLVTLAWVPATVVLQYALAMLQGLKQFRWFNTLRVLPVTLYSGAVLVFFLASAGGLVEVAIVLVVSYALVAVLAVAAVLRAVDLSSEAESPPRSEMLRFGLRGVLGSASPIETFRVDQAVVGLLISPAALGLYVVGLAFTNLPRFIGQSIGMVANPHVTGHASRATARRSMWRFFWLTTALAACVVVVVELLAGRLVPFFFGDAFRDATTITRILLVSALFLAARRALTDGARGLGQAGLGTIAELASWLVVVPALFALTPTWGAEGAAYATVISSAASLAVLVSLVLYFRDERSEDEQGAEDVVCAPAR